MSVRVEVENRINEEWSDKDVAKWVIKKFPLLERGYSYPACPIYELSLTNGLQLGNDNNQYPNFQTTKKIVMSGGFEGTEGHLKVVEEMHEARALTADSSSLIVLMIEPDSYVVNQKQREPLISLSQRTELWSTSGMVDAIICLPDRPDDVPAPDFYDKHINSLIYPATWCVNVENPHYFDILNRGATTPAYDLVRLFVHHIEVHTSFLSATQGLTKDEVREKLHDYLLGLIESGRYTTTKLFSPEDELTLYWEIIAKGL